MLTDDELWEKCKKDLSITAEDLGIHDTPDDITSEHTDLDRARFDFLMTLYNFDK